MFDSMVKTVHLCSKNIDMEFGLKKIGILILRRGKIYFCEKITLLDEQIMKETENDGPNIIGFVELDRVKGQEMREQFIKEYRRRLEKILKFQLNSKKKIQKIYAWVVAVLR